MRLEPKWLRLLNCGSARRRDFGETYGTGRKTSKLQGSTNFGPKFPNFSLKPFSVTNFPENIFLYRILRNFRISRQNHFLTQIFRKTCFCTEFREISEFHGISEKCLSEPKFPCFLNVGLKTRRAAYIYIARSPSGRHHRAAGPSVHATLSKGLKQLHDFPMSTRQIVN